MWMGGRLTSDPNRSSLGLLPSGPDPVGEWLVHRQPPGLYIGPGQGESKPAPTEPRPPRDKLPETNLRMRRSMLHPEAWSLHPQLAADTTLVGDLPLSAVRLMHDANYPWLILVPRRVGATEIVDLGASERAQLMTEIADLSRALKAVTQCDKLNVGAIGNVVPQLHVHIVARHRNDAAWPRPVWGAGPPAAYAPAALQALVAALRRELPIG